MMAKYPENDNNAQKQYSMLIYGTDCIQVRAVKSTEKSSVDHKEKQSRKKRAKLTS